MASTPEQFARKLGRLSTAVQTADRKAIEARALVTKEGVLAAAATRTHKVRPGWVRFRILNDHTAELRLRGGFAFLTQKGSYKKPGGYDERAKKVTARRRRSASARGETVNESGLMRTPYGPRAVVHHPFVKAKPFFLEGIDASRARGAKAYVNVQRNAIANALKK